MCVFEKSFVPKPISNATRRNLVDFSFKSDKKEIKRTPKKSSSLVRINNKLIY